MSRSPKCQRRKIFVNRKAQGILLLKFAGYWIVYHFVLLHTLFIFEFIQARVEMMNSGTSAPFSQLYADFWGKYYPLAATAFALLPFLIYDVIASTHRIVGPLVRFQTTMKHLREGKDVPDVKLREKDLLTDFESDFNEFLHFYREKMKAGNAVTNEELIASEEAEANDLEDPALLQETLSEAEMLDQVTGLKDEVRDSVEKHSPDDDSNEGESFDEPSTTETKDLS